MCKRGQPCMGAVPMVACTCARCAAVCLGVVTYTRPPEPGHEGAHVSQPSRVQACPLAGTQRKRSAWLCVRGSDTWQGRMCQLHNVDVAVCGHYQMLAAAPGREGGANQSA